MRTITTVAALLFFVVTLWAAPAKPPKSRIKGHPRLEYTASQINGLKKQKKEVDAAVAAAQPFLEKKQTATYPNYTISLPDAAPPRAHPQDKSWPYWTALTAEISADLQAVSYAYALTGEPRFLDRAKTLALAVSKWPEWSDPDYGVRPCLDTAALVRGVAVAYDYLYPALSEDERKTIRQALVSKGLAVIYEESAKEGTYYSDPVRWPNGYATVNAALGYGALAVLGEEEQAGTWVSLAMTRVEGFLDREGGRDGGLVEGLGYGTAAVDPLMDFAVSLQRVTGRSIFAHPYLKQAIYFPLYCLAPGGSTEVNFGDNGGPSGAPPALLGTARTLSTRGNGLATWYLTAAGQPRPRGSAAPTSPESLPDSRHFGDIGWAALRSGWEAEDVLLAFKSGPYRSHSHRDQNSFIIAAGGEWLANDQGYQRYDMDYPGEARGDRITAQHEYTYTTLGHNSLLVDGAGQEGQDGKIVGFATSPTFDYVGGDATACYPDRLQRFVRHVLFIKPSLFIIADDIETTGARELEWLLHGDPQTQLTVDQAAGTVTAVREKGQLVATLARPRGLALEVQQPQFCEAYGRYASAKIAAAAGRVHYVAAVQVGPKGATLPAIRTEGLSSMDEPVGFITQIGSDRVVAVVHGAQPTTTMLGGRSDGAVWFTRSGANDSVTSYGLADGKSLVWHNATLVDSEAPVWVSVDIVNGGVKGSISLAKAGTVRLYSPTPTITIDGRRVTGTPVPDTQLISLRLPAGEHLIGYR